MPATRKERRRALWGIIAAVFLVGTGVGSVLPILPLFLRERGSSYALVGIIVGANLVAQFIGQYPAGRLSDRFGRAPLMIGGLVVASLAIAAFALPLSIGWLIALRFIQGLGAAAFRPGARAAVADLVPEGERGIAYGWLAGADMAGLIVGPALGGVLAVFGRATVFEATGLAVLLAAAVVAIGLGRRRSSITVEPISGPLILGDRLRAGAAAVRGLLMLSMGIGFLYGVYNVVWSLFMKSIGATDWEVGLSFSLFALPLVLTAPLAGWAADRLDRRWLSAGSTASTTLIAPIYPFLHSVPAVIGVGVLEATTTAFAEPAINAFLMSAVAPDQRGRAAGTVGTGETAAKAVGALIGGGLFGLGVWVPFVVSSVVGLALILLGLPSLRAAGADLHPRAALMVAEHG
ncbi:MAG TPA: MFS transporter [Candidatus Dormibacteraeota bacterium]|nr:MFS transporter [Candidatus Dormibacteraeota bacterium]